MMIAHNLLRKLKKMKMIDEIKQWKLMDWLKAAIIIGFIMALGFIALNQYLQFRYSAIFLSDPCGLCRTLNPEVEECFYTKIKIEGINNKPIDAQEAIDAYNNWKPTSPID